MKKLLLLCLMLPGSIFTFAKNTVTTVEQVTSEVTLTDDVDYVITSATPFTGDGLINIVNTDHAVVILQNVKPSVVNAQKLYERIQINGKTATATSCQVRMYDNGTIIFPYSNLSGSNGFKPLTCYTKANYQGESSSNFTEGHSGGYMKTLTDNGFNNKIRSFKLKRGYMVTFAVGKGGWGYSRCFIADQEDLEIPSLPYMLNGKISSYRIFKWWNVHKAGLASDAGEASNAALNSGWCYDWGQGNETTLPDREWVPNHIYEDWPSSATCGSRTGACIMKTNNEPGNSADDHPQDVETVLDNWQNLMRTGLRLCSESSHDGSWSHLQNFIKAIDERGWRCDLLDLHCYWPAGSFGDFSNYYNNYGGRPIVISEWTWGASWNNNGIFSAAPDGRDSFSEANQQCMLNGTKPILDKLNASKYVERYAIWNSEAVCSKVYHDGQVSLFGQYYAENTGGLGYNASIQKIPTNQPLQSTSITDLKAEYSNTRGNVTLTWTDGNYERIDSFVVQVKRPGASTFTNIGAVYPEDQNAKDGATTATYTFVDEEPEVGGNIYQISARYNGNSFVSTSATATVSSNRAVGELRFGELQLVGDNSQTTTFINGFPRGKSPFVVLSSPSANNTVGKILNLRNVGISDFKASMAPNVKSDGTAYSLTNAESAGYLALPKDLTCCAIPALTGEGTLTLQCGTVSSVTTEWTHVSFEQPYDEGVTPVVIATALRVNAVTYGIMSRVKNITNTGFDVCIERQNYYAAQSFAGATVYFFAMQPGEASLGGGLLLSAQRFEDALAQTRPNVAKAVNLTTPLVKPVILLGAQSVKHDIMRQVFLYKTTKETVDGVSRVKSFTPNAYLDGTAETTGTAYSPSEDLGIIAVATDPNGSAEDEPTVTAVRSLEAGATAGGSFDAWTEGNVIRSNRADVHVYNATGLQFAPGQPLAKGIYIVTDGSVSKKLIIR